MMIYKGGIPYESTPFFCLCQYKALLKNKGHPLQPR